MRSYFLSCSALVVPFLVVAQVSSVRLTVHAPAIPENKNVYVSGSFNNWKAGDSLYKMKKIDATTYTITLPAFKNAGYQYKYTLGQWSEVETTSSDNNISNRSFFTAKNKIKVKDTVQKWAAPKPVVQNTNPQLLKINAMKDSLMKDLQPKLGEMLQLLKGYVVNLLQEKPDMSTEQKIVAEVNNHLKDLHQKLNFLFHKIFESLTAEQKQKILKALNDPNADKDFINTLGGAFGDAMK